MAKTTIQLTDEDNIDLLVIREAGPPGCARLRDAPCGSRRVPCTRIDPAAAPATAAAPASMLVRGLPIEEIAQLLRRDHGEVRDKVVEIGRACQ
jgi:hypothetical protein